MINYHQVDFVLASQTETDTLTTKSQYMEKLLSTKQIEPNESLGKAIQYMLKQW